MAPPHARPTASLRVRLDAASVCPADGVGRYSRSLLRALRAAGRDVGDGRSRRADVLHATSPGRAPLRPRSPTVVTVHDLSAFTRRSEALRGPHARLRHLAVQRAHAVICPTRSVAAEAEAHLGIPGERLHVIGEAADAAFGPRDAADVAAARARLGLPERYLLWVGDLERHEPRKRILELTRAPRTLPLVLAGPAGRWTERLAEVTLTGALADDDLAAVYTGAHALVFPSDDEGYGLAPVEALACGTPVAATDAPAVREVLGDRAAWADGHDLAGLVALAERLERPAPPPLGRTWSDVARDTWRVYESVAA